MTQLWDDILPSESLRDSRIQILNRDEAVKSQFSGNAFPTTDLVIGMSCYRLDLDLEHYLQSIGPEVWVPRPSGGPDGVLDILVGGTGASSAAGARTNLGLGGLAVLSAVDTGQIVDSAVTSAKIFTDAVDSTKIADNAVGLEHMKDNSVGTAELINGSVTLAKLDPSLNLGLPSGTNAFFNQTDAPTGWTKSGTHNNKAIRIVSGTVATGGSVGFTSALGTPAVSGGSVTLSGNTGSHVLTRAQMPKHKHNLKFNASGIGPQVTPGLVADFTANIFHTTSTTYSDETAFNPWLFEGNNEGHSHPNSGSGSLSGASVPINVQYVDTIIATKD